MAYIPRPSYLREVDGNCLQCQSPSGEVVEGRRCLLWAGYPLSSAHHPLFLGLPASSLVPLLMPEKFETRSHLCQTTILLPRASVLQRALEATLSCGDILP